MIPASTGFLPTVKIQNHFRKLKILKESKKLFVAGSTWSADEKLLIATTDKFIDEFKIVFVPHEISERHINSLTQKLGSKAIRYSEWDKKNNSYDFLIIDNVGMLMSLYKYADIAYVGGGFGKGIHNILEAAVFGIPVFFGPKFKKFREAVELVHWKGAFTVRHERDFNDKFSEIVTDPARLEKIKEINLRYIDNNKGATELIINYLKMN